MDLVLFLCGLTLPILVSAGEVSLLGEIQGLQASSSLSTTCPSPYHIFERNSVSTTQERRLHLHGSEVGLGEDASISLAGNLRECIPTSSSSAIYCVYTFPDFADGRGLSIVASPSIAPSIASAFSVSDRFQEPQQPRQFYEEALPGRGKGLMCNQTFRKGDLILTSTPIFMVQEKAMSDMSETDRLLLQQRSVASLPKNSRDLYYGLAGHFGGDQTEDVLLTNGFSASFGEVKAGFGLVIPEAARLNHDCRPNARFAFDPYTLIHKVHATRTIYPGEELTFSYIDTTQSYSVRQRIINSHWGFRCSCSLCSASEDARSSSDTRLERIAALRVSLFPTTAENLRITSLDTALEFVSLYEKEGLDGTLAEAYMVAALLYCASGNVYETQRWAALAVDNWLVWEAGGQTNLQVMKNLSRRPQDHWCWAAKLKIPAK